MTTLAKVKVGEYQTVHGRVMAREARRAWYTKKHRTEIAIDDGTGRIFCVWFNQPYLERYFNAGAHVVIYGKVEIYRDRLQMVAPEYEIIEDEADGQSLSIGRIVPIYPLTRGITQRYLRKTIKAALDKYLNDVRDILPVWLRNKHRLVNIRRSLANIHFPESMEEQGLAMRRVSFEEFFLFQLSVIRRRMSIVVKPGMAHAVPLELVNDFENSFPFALTGAQRRVIREIAGDMQKISPMLRLLQGDVGSGKTLVALFGCLVAAHNQKQAAIMAPTEILARQHYDRVSDFLKSQSHKVTPCDNTLPDLLNPKAVAGAVRREAANSDGICVANRTVKSQVKVVLLAGSMKKAEKEQALEFIRSGEPCIIVGTHALLSAGVEIPNLSFVVIDEQHKFGVRQRALLSAKGVNPDILVMTATPIPRTLSLTLFGDLDVSTLDEMPPGKGQVETKIFSVDQSAEVYKMVRELVEQQGHQAYIVYPLVEESEKLDLKAAESMFRHLNSQEFKGLRLGIIHGQMKKAEADAEMAKFKRREVDILVATTILEVGVDVPEAGVMLIEHAERFGLSQIHQLRGRVGRGQKNGVCFLIADPTTEDGVARLDVIARTTDGFKIAEEDLLIRGPGHYFGRYQHGLNELKFANPVTQLDILELARKEAEDVLHLDPDLKETANQVLGETILRRYPTYLEMVEAG